MYIQNKGKYIASMNEWALPFNMETIPIVTIPWEEDFVLKGRDACAKTKNVEHAFLGSSEFSDLTDKHQSLIDELKTYYPPEEDPDFGHLCKIFSTI